MKSKLQKIKDKKTNLKQEVSELKLSNEDLTFKISKLQHEININEDDLELVKKKYEEKLKDMKDNYARKMADQNEQIEALNEKKIKLKSAYTELATESESKEKV